MMRKTKSDAPAPAAKAPSKVEALEALLKRADGATIEDMVGATGWQQHSVRGALAGTLKKRGHTIVSEKVADVRRYRIVAQ